MPRTKAEDDKLPDGIRLLPSGMFQWRIFAGFREGKPVSVTGTTKTIREAKANRAKAIADKSRGVLNLPDSVNVREYTARWLERQSHLATNTTRTYARDIAHAVKHLGDMKVRDVRPLHVKDALQTLSKQIGTQGLGKGREMSSSTLAAVRTRLKAVFREALIDGVIVTDPTVSVKRVRVLRTEHPGVALDFEQAVRFHEIGEVLHVAHVLRLWPALFTAVSLGLRKGEVMALRWSDIDLEQSVLHIRQNLTTPNGKMEMRVPKTPESIRDLGMPESLKAMLTAHKAAMLEEAQACGETLRTDGAVFCTVQGKFTHPDNLHRGLTRLLEWSGVLEPRKKPDGTLETPAEAEVRLKRRMIGIPDQYRSRLEAAIRAGVKLPQISPHDLRHTAGTLMLRRGTPIEVVSKTLGHRDIALTYRVYRHVLESEKRAHVIDLFAAPVASRVIESAPLN